MNPTCDLCGSEMLWLDQSLDLDGRVGWVCPATPDQHKIATLEKQVAELETEIEASRARVRELGAQLAQAIQELLFVGTALKGESHEPNL